MELGYEALAYAVKNGNVDIICLAWVDVCAAVAAQRFARTNVVTAAMDSLSFLAPVRQGDIVIVKGMVNWAGRSSMEVGVRVEREDPRTGVRERTSTAYLTFVALGDDGRPTAVPDLKPETTEQRRRWDEACVRRQQRLAAKAALLASKDRPL
jgi:acyl-CoA hydrolase